MIAQQEIRRQMREAPDLPGVYLFRHADGTVLYVGKAASLRKRLASYLPATLGEDPSRVAGKVAEMVQRADAVEWIVASSEVEALLLEHNLIKRHRPPYNIRLRDDKSYPYIVITLEDEFPRVMFTRQPHRRGNLYFGPYGSAAKVRETLDTLGRIFPFRKCRGAARVGGAARRACSSTSSAAWPRAWAPSRPRSTGDHPAVADFLSGRHDRVAGRIEADMRAASPAWISSGRPVFRDRLEALRHVLERQRAKSGTIGSVDIVGMARDEHGVNVQVFLTRDGILADRRSFNLVNVEGVDDDEVFERFIGEYYATALVVPPEVIVPRRSGSVDRLAAFLQELRGAVVTVRTAERGDKRRLQELAQRNALLALEQDRLRAERTREHRYGAMRALQDLLDLPAPPVRLEGYDISNLGPEHIVASMVVFEGGVPRKDHYRTFAVESGGGQDDVGSIREVLLRRFSRAALGNAERYDPSFEMVPDLVMVDGGKGQLGAALSALEEVGLDEAVPVVSLAKREEEIFVPGHSEPLRLPADHPARLLLQRVRDEAHRFAVAYHRRRRAARTTDPCSTSCREWGEAQAGDPAALRLSRTLSAGEP